MKTKEEFKSMSLEEIIKLKTGVEDRVNRIINDMKKPMEQDLSEQAAEITQRNLYAGILEAEKSYLANLNAEIAQRTQGH